MVKSEPLIVNNFHTSSTINYIVSSSSSSSYKSTSPSSLSSSSSSSSSLLQFPSSPSPCPSTTTHQSFLQKANNCTRVRNRHSTKSTIITIGKSPSPSPPIISSSTTPQLKPFVHLIPKVTSQLNITRLDSYQSSTPTLKFNHRNADLNNNNLKSQSCSFLTNGYFPNTINSVHWDSNGQLQLQQQQQHQPTTSISYSTGFQTGLSVNNSSGHVNSNNLYPLYQQCPSSTTSSPSTSPLIVDNQLALSSQTSTSSTPTNVCPMLTQSCPTNGNKLCSCLNPSLPLPDSSSPTVNKIKLISTNSNSNNNSNSNSECSTIAYPLTVSTNSHNNKPSKPRRRVATVAQRRAANIRERRRMFHLNTAFDKLRKKVPTFAYEKRLSRIETLRLAVMYITFMNEILKSNQSTSNINSSQSTSSTPPTEESTTTTSTEIYSPRIPLHTSTVSFHSNHQIHDTSSSSSSSSWDSLNQANQ